MTSVSFTFDRATKRYLKDAERRLGRDDLYEQITRLFNREGLKVAGRISKNYLSGQRVNRRSGNLARSITGQGVRINGVPALQVGIFRGPSLKYAATIELGTKGKNPDSPIPTIRPRSGQALAVPVGDEVLTGAGVDRFGGPRNFPGELYFIPFRNSGVAVGGLYSAVQRDIGQQFGLREARAAYLLLTEVDIEPRYFLRDGFQERLPFVAKELSLLLRDLLRKR